MLSLSYIQPKDFQVHLDWTYTSDLTVEDHAAASGTDTSLVKIYFVGDGLGICVQECNEGFRRIPRVTPMEQGPGMKNVLNNSFESEGELSESAT